MNSHRGPYAFTILLIAAAFVAGGAGQSAAQPVLNFKRIVNNWPTIEVYFAVTCNGQPVFPVDKAKLKIVEDGREITNFDLWCPDPTMRCAISVALVMDASGSMMGVGNAGAKAAGHAFVDLMDGKIDEAAVIWFNSVVSVYQTMTTSKDLLHNAVNALPASGGTAVWDGIYTGLLELIQNGVNQCRAVIALTDGGDNASSHQPAEIIALATRNRIRVFTIGLGSGINSGQLLAIANLTGGRYYETPNAAQLAAIYQEISTLIFQGFQECIITYTATCMDGGTRAVDLSVLNVCGGADMKTKTYTALKDTTTFSTMSFRLGSATGRGNTDVFIPLELLTPISNETIYASAMDVFIDPACVSTVGFDAPPGSLLAGVPVTVQPTSYGAQLLVQGSAAWNASPLPALVGNLVLRTVRPSVQNPVTCPVSIPQWTFSKGCRRAVVSSGSVTVLPRTANLNCSFIAHSKLTWDIARKDYLENPITVQMPVTNSGDLPGFNGRYTIHYNPDDFRLVSPTTATQQGIPRDVAESGSSTVQWTLQARRRLTGDSVNISITGSFDNHPDITCGRKIWIPAGEPDLECTATVPAITVDTVVWRYTPMPFNISAMVTNRGINNTDTLYARITAAPELRFDSPTGPTTSVRKIAPAILAPAQQGSVTWTVWHPVSPVAQTYPVSIISWSANTDTARCELTVDIPALDPPLLFASCFAPDSLAFDQAVGDFIPNPFTVSVSCHNRGRSAVTNAAASLVLPPGVVFVDPLDSLVKTFNPSTLETYQGGPFPTLSWTVRCVRNPRDKGDLEFRWKIQARDANGIPVDTIFLTCRLPAASIAPMYRCDLVMPDSLEMNTAGTDVQPNPFSIRYRLWNVSRASGMIVFVELDYPPADDLTLAPTTPKTRFVNTVLNYGDTLTVDWLMSVRNRLTRRLSHFTVAAWDVESGSVTGTPPCAHDLPISNVTTLVRAESPPMPSALALEPPIPNPFTTGAIIPYSIRKASHVTVGVYNTLGVLVKELTDGHHAAGNYRLSWDGKDAGGLDLAAGVYVLRMSAQGADGDTSSAIRILVKL